MFHLNDPTGEVLSQAGANFGKGAGDSLVNVAKNRALQRALQGVNPQTSPIDVLNRFSQNNVPLELQNQFFNPVVQQRLGQQRAAQVFENIAKTKITGENLQEVLGQVYTALADIPGGAEAAQPIVNAIVERSKANGIKPPTTGGVPGIPPAGNPPSPPRPFGQNRPMQPLANESSNPYMAQGDRGTVTNPSAEGVPGNADVRSNIPIGPTQQSIASPEQRASAVSALVPFLGSVEAAEKWVDTQQAQQIKQGEIQAANQERSETQRKLVLDEENRIRGVAASKLPENYNPEMRDLVAMTMMAAKGPDEERFATGKRVADRVINGLHSLSTTTRPAGAAFRPGKLGTYLNKKQASALTALNDPDLPEIAKPAIMEQYRTVLAGAGDGPVESEYIINPLQDADVKLLNSTPRAPFGNQPYSKTKGGIRGGEKGKEADARSITTLADIISKIASRNAMASPFIIRDGLLNKGYSESQILQAFNMARENGVQFSPYQFDQMTQLNTPQKPGLNTIFGGDQSQNTVWQQYFQGRR